MVAIIAWSGLGTFIIFGGCQLFGLLRMPFYAEIYGLDMIDNGVYAINNDLSVPQIMFVDQDEDGSQSEASMSSSNFKLKKTKTIVDHFKEFDKHV